MSVEEIKKLEKEGKLQIGEKTVTKKIINGQISKIFICKNISDELRMKVESWKKKGITAEPVDLTNKELGEICKKPYAISIIGVIE